MNQYLKTGPLWKGALARAIGDIDAEVSGVRPVVLLGPPRSTEDAIVWVENLASERSVPTLRITPHKREALIYQLFDALIGVVPDPIDARTLANAFEGDPSAIIIDGLGPEHSETVKLIAEALDLKGREHLRFDLVILSGSTQLNSALTELAPHLGRQFDIHWLTDDGEASEESDPSSGVVL